MKKLMSLLLAIIMCVSLAACGGEQNNDNFETLATDGPGANSDADMDWLLRDDLINFAKLRECVEIVELTTDNWKEHLKIYHYSYSYDEEIVEKDAFGEIISTEIVAHTGEGYAFGAGNERYHGYNDVEVELKDKTTGELIVYDFNEGSMHIENWADISIEDGFVLDNYACARIKGSIYYLNIPMGELPVKTYLWPYPYDVGAGAIYVSPGTNSFSAIYLKDWLS